MTVLTRPAYLAAVVILVVNDVWLKYAWPGFITGKLSDVAGLFAFAVFAAWVTRRPALACIATGIAFVIWKSPLVEPLIEGTPFSRVPDQTDLFALLILPFAYLDCGSRAAALPAAATPPQARAVALPPHSRAHALIALLSVAAFVNTSVARHSFDVPNDYPQRFMRISQPADRVFAQAEKCGLYPETFVSDLPEGKSIEYLNFSYEAKLQKSKRDLRATTLVTRKGDVTILEFTDMNIYRETETGNEQVAMADFTQRLNRCFGALITPTSASDRSSGN